MSERRLVSSERSLAPSTGLIVVKLGGSVVRSSELQSWLDAIAQGAGRIVVVPGGGALADEVRAATARLYLEQPDIAIAEVAYLLGFADQSTFNRAFKRWTGTTPARSRAPLRGPAPGAERALHGRA